MANNSPAATPEGRRLRFMAALEAFESLTGLQVCLHDYAQWLRRAVGRQRDLHFHPLCRAVKASNSKAEKRCMECDIRLVQQRFGHSREPLLKRCHADVDELVYPVQLGREIIGAFFAGPFQISPESPSNAWKGEFLQQMPLTPRRKELERQMLRLPILTTKELLQFQALAGLLVAELEALVATLNRESIEEPGYRERIRRFVETNFSIPLRLAHLAAHLHLSESRTSQLVRQHFKSTFPELLTATRLDYAQRLLKQTDFSIANVSERVGITDAGYFRRLFRQSTGFTPSQYRRERKHSLKV